MFMCTYVGSKPITSVILCGDSFVHQKSAGRAWIDDSYLDSGSTPGRCAVQ
ncbi:hypothetical protein J6590_046381 [Homalodisca vitripennis]|nr:hypothetical protein J6590_046381 [Homalodisca vitripennis]